MTPPRQSEIEPEARPSETPSAVSHFVPLEVLRKRADFLRAAQARRQGSAGLMVQGRARGDDSTMVRVGFTASKKIGNAVARNRAKRRMRALARAVLAPVAQAGWDYVLVARPGATVERPWDALVADLSLALTQLHRPQLHRPK